MKGKKYQYKNSENVLNSNYNKNSKVNPHVNVLQFDIGNGYNNNSNFNFNNNVQNKNPTKNVRNLSQKPMRRTNNKYYDNNHNYNNNYNYNINSNNNYPQNNFMVVNSNPLSQKQNMINNNMRNQKLAPINIGSNLNNNQRKFINNNNYNKAKSKEPTKLKSEKNNNNFSNNDKIKIKLDQKGVYICDDEDEYENPNDVVNDLNVALKNKKENNLQMSQEENNMIETIKKVSTNRVKYRNTHQMLREIGKIMKDPVVSFLIQKDPIEAKKDSPSDKLSEMLSQKLLEEQKRKLLEQQKEKERNEEDQYYEQLQRRIKDEIKKKGSFDFSKLPDRDRKILAQRKLYNKLGMKVYDDNSNTNANENANINNNVLGNNNNNNNTNDNHNNTTMQKEEFNQKIDKKIKEEINREAMKENFLKEIEKYNEEDDDYFNIGKINNNKKIGEDNEDAYNINVQKEKPTARGILEKVLNQIEYKNEQLINHKDDINDIIIKKDNKNPKKKK